MFEITEQEINEGNEIIAKFLNFIQKSYTPNSEKMWCDPKHGLPVGELLFHSDWNWLIPAIKKIASSDDIRKAGIANIMSMKNYDIIEIWKTIVEHVNKNKTDYDN